MKSTYLILVASIYCCCSCVAQHQGSYWCFGDSASISFLSGIPVCASPCVAFQMQAGSSIADSAGNLLFYTRMIGNNYGTIYNMFNSIMINGDSLQGVSQNMSQGFLILPQPCNDSLFYVFYPGYSTLQGVGLSYAVINMKAGSGLGSVIQKNILIFNDTLSRKLTSVKHGNGKDWWIIVHQESWYNPSNLFYILKLDSNGVNINSTQNIGTSYDHTSLLLPDGIAGQMVFSLDGHKLAAVGNNLVDVFDFDRCSGVLSNYISLIPPNYDPHNYWNYGCSFSPDATKLYVSKQVYSTPVGLYYSNLMQYDLSSINIISSQKTIYSIWDQNAEFGEHLLGPDRKIYLTIDYGPGFPNNYYNNYNMNLSVINEPNLYDTVCNFVPYSVSLCGKRAFAGLPNLPNYNLGADTICDSLLASFPVYSETQLSVYPNPATKIISIEFPASFLDKKFSLTIYDATGRKVKEEIIIALKNIITTSIQDLVVGVYFVAIDSGGNKYYSKFVKE